MSPRIVEISAGVASRIVQHAVVDGLEDAAVAQAAAEAVALVVSAGAEGGEGDDMLTTLIG